MCKCSYCENEATILAKVENKEKFICDDCAEYIFEKDIIDSFITDHQKEFDKYKKDFFKAERLVVG